jgi:hypothetical protein
MSGDIYNFGSTVPDLFAAHERRYQEAQELIASLQIENAELRADALGWILDNMRLTDTDAMLRRYTGDRSGLYAAIDAVIKG